MFAWLLGDKKPKMLTRAQVEDLPAAEVWVEGKGRARWQGQHSLLDALDEAGMAVRSSCRSGNCGACLAYLDAGEVAYVKEPGFPLEAGECLMCSCVPLSPVRLRLPASQVPPRRRKS